jgi:hypothetical protein
MICFWHTHPFTSLGFEIGDISEVVLNLNNESLTYPQKALARDSEAISLSEPRQKEEYKCGEETR